MSLTNSDKFTVFRDDIRFLSDQMWPKWVKTDILTFRMAKTYFSCTGSTPERCYVGIDHVIPCTFTLW